MDTNNILNKIMTSYKYKSTDEYISMAAHEIQPKLNEIRNYIKEAAPEAKEVISYNMPAFKANGVLVYFAANKSHLGFYPTTSPIVVFEKELKEYKTSKGAIQFPLEKPLPKELIQAITKYRINEDLEKSKSKKK